MYVCMYVCILGKIMLKKKLFHPASILSGYRETWRLQKQVAFRFPGTARGGVASP